MTKADLVARMAKDSCISKREAAQILESLLVNVRRALKKGERVNLIGFGTFSVARRKARAGRSPQTGKAIRIPAAKVVRFRAGSALKSAVKLATGPHGPKAGP